MNRNDRPRTQITYPADDQVVVTAWFNAPRELVFRAFTDPALVRQWWGRPAGELTTCEIDLRIGGEWRYVYTPDAGEPASFRGVYLDVAPPERVSYIDVLESLGGIEVRNTVTFDQIGERTQLTIVAQHQSKANRDAQAATLVLDDAGPEPFDALEHVALASA